MAREGQQRLGERGVGGVALIFVLFVDISMM